MNLDATEIFTSFQGFNDCPELWMLNLMEIMVFDEKSVEQAT